MGLTPKSSSIYLSTFGGDIVRRVKADTPDAVSRVNKDGNTVWELQNKSVIGMLINVTSKESDYGTQLLFTINSDDGTFILQVPFRSGSADGFFKRMDNIAWDLPLEFMPWQMTDEYGKSKSGMTVHQNGKKVPLAHSKDEPNGLPPMEKVILNKKDVWDSTKQIEFFIAKLDKYLPIITANVPTETSSSQAVHDKMVEDSMKILEDEVKEQEQIDANDLANQSGVNQEDTNDLPF